jgi:hemerythrin-like domain-containing protein
MSNPKPIKRSTQLAPLSREHHDALLFAWKIKQGLANGTTTGLIREYVQWYWEKFLDQHFREEEDILLPYLPPGDLLSKQLLSEHQRIRHSVQQPADAAALAALAESLNNHIRFEERQFFPHLEERLSPDQLDSIFKRLEKQPQCNDTWPEEFWTRKK